MSSRASLSVRSSRRWIKTVSLRKLRASSAQLATANTHAGAQIAVVNGPAKRAEVRWFFRKTRHYTLRCFALIVVLTATAIPQRTQCQAAANRELAQRSRRASMENAIAELKPFTVQNYANSISYFHVKPRVIQEDSSASQAVREHVEIWDYRI